MTIQELAVPERHITEVTMEEIKFLWFVPPVKILKSKIVKSALVLKQTFKLAAAGDGFHGPKVSILDESYAGESIAC